MWGQVDESREPKILFVIEILVLIMICIIGYVFR